MKKPLTWIKLFVTLGVLAYLVYAVDPNRIWEAAKGAHGGWILAAVALIPLNLAFGAWRWLTVLHLVMPEAGFMDALASMLCGRSLGFFTPARLGEYAGRVFYLDHPRKWELVALTAAEQIPGMIWYLGCGLVALLYLRERAFVYPEAVTVALLVVGVGGLVLLVAFLTGPAATYRLLTSLLPFQRLRSSLAFLTRLAARDIRLLLGITLLAYAVFSTQFFLLLRALTPTAEVATGYAGIALVYMAKSVLPPVTIMDLGIREGAAVFFLTPLGLPEAAAFNAAFLIFALNVATPALLGLPFAWRLWRTPETAPTVHGSTSDL